MLSTRQVKPRRLTVEEDGLDVPVDVQGDFAVNRLGRESEHLFLLELRTPIGVTAASVTHRYKLPYPMTIHKRVLYQTTAAGAASADGLNIQLNVMHLNRTPEIEYYKEGVSWVAGGTRLTGKTYTPPCEYQVIVDGTATNLLYLSLEVEVHHA